MKLTSLKTVEVLNAKSLNLINGGLKQKESSKKDDLESDSYGDRCNDPK